MDSFHHITIEKAFDAFATSPKGLSAQEAASRLKKYGKNIIKEEKTNKLGMLLRQFKSPLIYILLIASLTSALIGEWADFILINIVILINGILGFWQELKAETSIASLKKLTETKNKVMRDGILVFITSSELVPGDYIVFHEGEVVSADVRLTESTGLMTDEASLTGESIPTPKDHQLLHDEKTPLIDHKNMLFAGSVIVRGSGRGIVVKTGSSTYLATIAKMADEPSPETPLTKSLNFFAKRYLIILIILFSLLALFGLLQGRKITELAYILLAGLVSAVPSGLPLVITFVMVIGAIALSKRKALIRFLPSVETLGSATIIASDKTGTITEGKLIVKETFSSDMEKIRLIAALCNDSHEGAGDPLDIALSDWADLENIKEKYPRQWAYSFDTRLMLMATVHIIDGKKELFVKGAYEALKEKVQKKEELEEIEKAMELFLKEGLRVLAFGYGDSKSEDPNHWKIKIVGIIGFLDPPKAGVKEAVTTAQKGGIHVLMITGDHPMTAKAVAKEVCIWKEGDAILTGKEIEQMSDERLLEALKKTTVIARMLPEQKYRIVKILQTKKEIVAVTGDGVNDVPALKASDIGIAMGSGTEVAKSVSKMIISDNNLATIIEAVKNARVIVDNIRKVIYYLVSTSLQEILIIALAIFSSLPLPLSAIQILWINLVTDGIQDKLFPFASAENDVMKRKPRKLDEKFLDLKQLLRIAFFGISVSLLCFVIYVYLLKHYSFRAASTTIFISSAAAQWANGIQAQKEQEPFFKSAKKSFLINPYIFLGFFGGLVLQIMVINFIPQWFHCEKINMDLWKYPALVFISSFGLVEIRKWIEIFFKKIKKRRSFSQ